MTLPQLDRRVVQAAIRGDTRAFDQIVETYRPAVLRYVSRMVRDPELAEDLVQDVFLNVYQRLPGFSSRSLFTTWLFQVSKNRVIDELRAAQRRPLANGPIESLALLEERAPASSDEHEIVEAIWRAVPLLEEEMKMSLLLRDVAGFSYREIADLLETDLGTVKWRIFRAREIIQETLAQEGLVRPSSTPKRAGRALVGAPEPAAATG